MMVSASFIPQRSDPKGIHLYPHSTDDEIRYGKYVYIGIDIDRNTQPFKNNLIKIL